ncbi:hypothetical protein ASF53_23710 [Methylobacterium sp. Leaf123]|uniref:hypothetical protein n=1 Tax=Methylobacterium sp. Leaf123 TaxID=1736264 RepID=UPI0006F58281|nr:hypothetical protein [Methylobacterium sp. Leaf123]KQQ20135.1 hypothetical protein ASF53_23710 [Methylobacterium sp. Leaf123]
MPDKLKRTLLGAVIAVALAAAVSYGLISQQTADKLQTEANQTLNEGQPGSPSQQPAPSPEAQNSGNPQPTPREPTQPNPAPAAR